MRRAPVQLALWAMASMALGGCGDLGDDRGSITDAGGDVDAELGGGRDGGPPDPGADGGTSIDAGEPADAGADPETEPEGLPATTDTERGDLGYSPDDGDFDGESGARERGDARACYDREGDDEDGIDCADPSCQVLRSCCVGSGDCCADAGTWLGGAIDLSDTDTCEGAGELTATDCLADAGFDVSSFGMPAPFVFGDGLHPNGDSSGDSGLLLGGSRVDLRTHRVVIETGFTKATGCGASCLEGVAVGLTTQSDLAGVGDGAYVRPAVALTLSSSRDRVSLVVAEEVVASRPYAEGHWELVVRPTGRVTASPPEGSGIDGMAAQLVPEAGARLVLWGRNRNTDETRANVSYLSATTALCDNPTVWTEREEIVLRAAGISEPMTIAGADNPSLAAVAGGSAWLAFDAPTGPEGARALHVAARSAGAELESFALRPPESASPTAPALSPGGAHDAAGMRDPELVSVGDGELVLLYTAEAEGGALTIGRAVTTNPEEGWTVNDMPVLGSVEDATQYSQPTVARRDADHWIMAVEVDDGSGEPELRLFHSDDTAAGGIWTPDFAGNELDGQLRDPGQRAPRYVADAVGATSLTIHDGAWQLYYARRRGTRWSVGLLASHELIYWRHVDDGSPVLAEGSSNFDRLGLRSPDAIGRGDSVELVYVGLDGTDGGLGIARRPATDAGEFPP